MKMIKVPFTDSLASTGAEFSDSNFKASSNDWALYVEW